MNAAEFLIRKELQRYQSDLTAWAARIERLRSLTEALGEAGRRPTAGHLLRPLRHALAGGDESRANRRVETALAALAGACPLDTPARLGAAKALLPRCRDWPKAHAALERRLRRETQAANPSAASSPPGDSSTG